MAEKYVLLDKSKEIVHTSTSFEDVKEKLSDITEFDDGVTNEEWEKIQQLNIKSLPHSVGVYEFYRECEQREASDE